MPFVIVGDELDFDSITNRLFKPNLTDATKARLRTDLLKANPGLDINQIRPGTVITVPKAPEFKPRDDQSLDDNIRSGLAMSREELTAQVRLIAQVADAGITNAAQDRDQMAKQLSRQDVARLMDDTFLRPALAETRAALDSDRADSDRALETVKKAVEQWNGDLGSLDRLAP